MPAAAIIFILLLFCTAIQCTAWGGLRRPPRPSIEAGLREHQHWRDPYVAEWSNRQGDRLIITGSTIKFSDEKPVPYHDVTRVTNGREFHLEITSDTKLNYLARFLHVSFGEGDKTDQMKVTLYNSRKDMESGANSQGEAIWYRDK
jgi:hypothetical protein